MIFAYLLIAGFFGIEAFMRKGEQARSLHSGESDRGSTILIGAAFGTAIAVAPVLNYLRIGQLADGAEIGWVGILMMLSGLALRLWAMKTLGRFYTRTLLVAEGQRILRQGPYQMVRHPGYLGTILVWIGAGLASANWIAVATVTLLMLAAYVYRIRAEEAMLAAAFGEEYRAYAAHTWKLIPFVY